MLGVEHMWKLGFVAVVAVIVLLYVLWRNQQTRMNAKMPLETATATVADRQMVKYRRGRGIYGHIVVEYFVTFRPDRGMSREFQVGEAEYDAYHLGDRGPLTWQGDTFVSFRPERREESRHDVPVAFNEEKPD